MTVIEELESLITLRVLVDITVAFNIVTLEVKYKESPSSKSTKSKDDEGNADADAEDTAPLFDILAY